MISSWILLSHARAPVSLLPYTTYTALQEMVDCVLVMHVDMFPSSMRYNICTAFSVVALLALFLVIGSDEVHASHALFISGASS